MNERHQTRLLVPLFTSKVVLEVAAMGCELHKRDASAVSS